MESAGDGSALPARTLYEEALAMYASGDYSGAAEKITASFADGQAEPKAMALLARIHANQGRLVQAAEWCDKAIAANRLDASFHYLRATILEEQSRQEDAEECLRRVLYLDPHFVLAHFALGNIALRRGKTKESRRYFQNTLKLLENCPREQVLPESEGITAGRLREMIQTMELVT